jgi:small subunit ribosomal protein S9
MLVTKFHAGEAKSPSDPERSVRSISDL